jgi:23S rRNA G2445 N2-methylase RlmL
VLKNRDHHLYFVTCAPGLEPVLHAELNALKLRRVERQVGGCVFEGSQRDSVRANLWLRTAIRVLRRLQRFDAPDEDTLYAVAREVEWERLIEPEASIVIDAQSRDSKLNHTRYVEQLVKDAIVDRFRAATGERPSVDKEDFDLRVHVHLARDRATLSVDTSGHSLHRRGWRVHQGRAPLSETSAAGIVLHSGWDRRAPLLDPFCGSGTILIEAAWIASGRAPGSLRKQFGFERWLDHDPRVLEELRSQAEAQVRTPRKLSILGWDRDPQRVEEARENIESAGVQDLVKVERAAVRDFAPRPGWNAWIVTNPPYGERVGDVKQLEPLYREFGENLRERCAGYRLALLSGNMELAAQLGFEGIERTFLKNGAIDCELIQVQV